MNETFAEGVELAQGIVDQRASGTGNVDVVSAPPLVDLKGVSEVLAQAGVQWYHLGSLQPPHNYNFNFT